MNIRTATFANLTSEEIALWSAIQRSEPLLASPYFRPEFTQAVAGVCNDVEVAVLEEDRRPVGFFPYQRRPWDRAVPVGRPLSDYHGVIARQGVEYDPIALVRGCGLSSWCFDHLLSPLPSFTKFIYRYSDAPHVDLSQGFDVQEAALTAHFRQEQRRRRKKLEREIGPLRFEPDVRDHSILATLMAWKIEQYKRTNAPNALGIGWVRELLERILDFRGHDFSAMMSVLYAGDRVLSIAYHLRSGSVLHAWFPAYDRAVARYAPGMMLTLEILRNAHAQGIDHYDFGKGQEDYKRIFRTGVTQVAEGAIDLSPLSAVVRSAWWNTRERIRTSPLSGPARAPIHFARRVRHWLAPRSTP